MTSQVDAVDFARVRDGLERVRVEHDEIGALARGNRAELVRDKDGRTDGLFCQVERYERGNGVTAKAVVTVDA